MLVYRESRRECALMGLQANPAHRECVRVAIYSLHHSPIGKSTQAQPYTAAAHINYITRRRAMSMMQKERLPGQNPREIAEHLKACEDQDRKNARVIDKVMLALPKELSQVERVKLVRDFAEHVTQGRAAWLAAFHDKGKDARNPHCHLVIRDRDPKTNKRVIGTSEKGSTDRLRESWELFANRALERAGRSERIDRRTLVDQGIEREPTIHEGPRSQAMDKRGAKPKSKQRRVRNAPGAKRPERNVDYRRIDKGKSRPELNRSRREPAYENERDYWDAVDRDNQNRELGELDAIHNPHGEPRPSPTAPRQHKPRAAEKVTPAMLRLKPSKNLAKRPLLNDPDREPQPSSAAPALNNKQRRPEKAPREMFKRPERLAREPRLNDFANNREPQASRPALRPRHEHTKPENNSPHQAAIKPSDRLPKKPRFKDLDLNRRRQPPAAHAGPSDAQAPPATPPRPKWSPRDQRALDRMKRERANDRSRGR